jgi:hypothetical protein
MDNLARAALVLAGVAALAGAAVLAAYLRLARAVTIVAATALEGPVSRSPWTALKEMGSALVAARGAQARALVEAELRRTLIEAARAAARGHGTYFSAQYARIARRRGPNKAAVAVANSMLATIWHLLTTGALYQDPGADYFERRHDPVLEAKRLQRRIEALGFDVTLSPKAAA